MTLAAVGASSPGDQQRISAALAQAGPDRFAEAFYRAQGLAEVADYLARAAASPSARVA